MTKHQIRIMFQGFLGIILILSLVTPVIAADNTKEIVQTSAPKVGTVTLKANVTADIINLNLVPSDRGQTASFTLSVHNNSKYDINFVDYWVNLLSKSGSKFSVNLAPTNVDKIPAQSSQDVQFYSSVGKTVKATDLIFQMIEWDFTLDSYERVLANVTVPQRYAYVTAANVQRAVITDSSKLNVTIKQAIIGKSDTYYRPAIKINIKNSGNKGITLPDYQFYVLTSEGLMYQMQVNGLNGTNLGPLIDMDFQLTGSIPIEVKTGNWKLVMMNTLTDKKINLPLALFALPKAESQDSATDIGKYYTFSDANGIYNIKLNSINRLPIEDQDIIAANLILTNNSNETVVIPSLTGTYQLDDNVERTATVIVPDKIIGIKPGESIDVQAMCKIPYTFDVSNLKLKIQEKDSSGSTAALPVDLVSFTYSGDFNPVRQIAAGQNYQITDLGSRSSVIIRKAITYSGDTANIFAAQVTFQNKEKRLTNIEKMAGYFKLPDGTVFPATLTDVKDKVSPSGTGLVYAWATIPKDVDTKSLQLVLGKAVENVDTTGTQLVGYVNPIGFNLPSEKPEQQGLQNMDAYPYDLTINHVSTQVMYQTGVLDLKFDYNMLKNLLVKTDTNAQQLVVEVKDDANNISFSKELNFEHAADGTVSDTTLKLGSNSMEIKFSDDPNLVFKINNLKDFSFNVYQQMQSGQRKLITTKKVTWFTVTD